MKNLAFALAIMVTGCSRGEVVTKPFSEISDLVWRVSASETCDAFESSYHKREDRMIAAESLRSDVEGAMSRLDKEGFPPSMPVIGFVLGRIPGGFHRHYGGSVGVLEAFVEDLKPDMISFADVTLVRHFLKGVRDGCLLIRAEAWEGLPR